MNLAFAAFSAGFDRYVLGGAISFLVRLAHFTGVMSLDNDEDGLNAGFNATSEKLRGAGKSYSKAQTGDAHGYLRVLALAFVVLVLLVVLGGGR